MNKDILQVFANLSFNEPPNLHKIKELSFDETDTDERIIGLVESSFYNSKEMLCFDFYKHITRVVESYDF